MSPNNGQLPTVTQGSLKDRPLQVEVSDGELVIRIGIETLAFSAGRCQALLEYPGEHDPPYCKIVDANELALDVCRELQDEQDDGTTPLDELLDRCIVNARENGSAAFDEAFEPEEAGGPWPDDEDDGSGDD